MGTVFAYKGGWRFKYKDATGAWITVTSKATTKAQARSENPEKWTVADLMRWWLDTYSRHHGAHESNEGTIRNHILGSDLAGKLLEHVKPGERVGTPNRDSRPIMPIL